MYRQNVQKLYWLSAVTNSSKQLVREQYLQKWNSASRVTCCHYSTPSRRPNFFSQLLENIKQEMDKNKEMKESLKKFREERQKLEESEALKKARKKYQTVETEASKSSEVLKERLDTIKEKVQDVMEEAGKSEIAKKAGQLKEGIGKTARDAAETISERGQQLGKTGAFQTLSQTAAAVKEELDHSTIQARMYKSPTILRRRLDNASEQELRTVEPNLQATGVELHKDSRFYQSWQNFKENNPYVNKVLDWKIKYDESDNPVIRASRMVTEKVTDIMGGLFQKTELSETLTEICKIDPGFDRNDFLKQCEVDFIPNILESIIRGELEILRDWCHEGPYNILSTPIKQAKQLNLIFASKVIDIDNVDLVMGKVMEQGPVLVISFTSQQIMCMKDLKGNVIEGDPNKVFRVDYVWVLCRDATELNPRAAWRLLDLSMQSNEQLL